MRFAYREDQLLVRDTVRGFVRDRIVPNADRWNEAGAFPLELLPELAALGLLGLAVPVDYGGAGLDLLTIALVMEELGAGDGSVALTLAAHNSLCISHLLIAASEEQKRRWLPPLVRGDDLIALGMKPGPKFGEILEAVETRQLEGVLNNREQALEWLRREYASEERKK